MIGNIFLSTGVSSHVSERGDTERQAVLRDELTRTYEKARDEYVPRILSAIESGKRLLDIGCGTGHIIKELATYGEKTSIVGLDISRSMIGIACRNTEGLSNASLVLGDGLDLPFRDSSFDVVTSRLADYLLPEVHRVLRRGGRFFEYGLGPRADREIAEFFPHRLESSNFFFPEDPQSWTDEVSNRVKKTGFRVTGVQEYETKDYYRSEHEVADLIEMVPLVKGFDRKKDGEVIRQLARKYMKDKGIAITWHYYILEALKH